MVMDVSLKHNAPTPMDTLEDQSPYVLSRALGTSEDQPPFVLSRALEVKGP